MGLFGLGLAEQRLLWRRRRSPVDGVGVAEPLGRVVRRVVRGEHGVAQHPVGKVGLKKWESSFRSPQGSFYTGFRA
jgi:hypothetical protein